jgi:hypothetical protein
MARISPDVEQRLLDRWEKQRAKKDFRQFPRLLFQAITLVWGMSRTMILAIVAMRVASALLSGAMLLLGRDAIAVFGGTCTIGSVGTGSAPCSAPAAQSLTFNGTTTDPGEYTLLFQVFDRAGNTSPITTIQYYIDRTAPTVSGTIPVPTSITTGTSFSSSASDNMDLASATGFLSYPISLSPAIPTSRLRIAYAGPITPSAGVAFDNVLTRSGNVTITLSNFLRALWTIDNAGVISAGNGTKPDSVGLRASDAAGNLSPPNEAFLPGASISGPSSPPFTNTGSLTGMTITVDNAIVSNGTTGTGAYPRAATFTANVTAPSPTSTTPLDQVCFYLMTPTGAENGPGNKVTGTAATELTLLNCTPTFATIESGGVRTFKYVSSLFDPDALYGTLGKLSVFAIGVTANGDGIMPQPAVITLAP